MLELFRRNQIVYFVFVIIYAILASIPMFLPSHELQLVPDGILFNLIIPFFSKYQLVGKTVWILLLLMKAYLLSEIVGSNRIAASNSLFPGVLYILLISLLPDFAYLQSIFFANFFFILALRAFFDSEHRKRRGPKLFNTFFFLSIASMFSPLFVGLIIPFLLITEVYINIRWKDFLIALIAWLTGYYLVGGTFYLMGDFELFWKELQESQRYGFDLTYLSGTIAYAKLAVFALLFVILISTNQDMAKSITINGRRKLAVLNIILVSSAIVFVIARPGSLSNLMLIIPVLSALLACLFLTLRNRRLVEVIHLLLIGALIIFQFFIT